MFKSTFKIKAKPIENYYSRGSNVIIITLSNHLLSNWAINGKRYLEITNLEEFPSKFFKGNLLYLTGVFSFEIPGINEPLVGWCKTTISDITKYKPNLEVVCSGSVHYYRDLRGGLFISFPVFRRALYAYIENEKNINNFKKGFSQEVFEGK